MSQVSVKSVESLQEENKELKEMLFEWILQCKYGSDKWYLHELADMSENLLQKLSGGKEEVDSQLKKHHDSTRKTQKNLARERDV